LEVEVLVAMGFSFIGDSFRNSLGRLRTATVPPLEDLKALVS
jgi:hypothetical protein